eukprot:TRINITY_DN13519_c0_g1_i11.p1 TRINITY_DN13519_c0_g1~~TRINITY_DN13519_c0_g1_i11.p1  ORF type:complete len:277 (+),score=82.79 TRINITY_DN13519_c0_g1_i11:138-968(+)
MLPDINFSKPPLDTSIVFSTKSYNYYNIKCKGFAKLGMLTKVIEGKAEKLKNPVFENAKLKRQELSKSPQRKYTEQFTLKLKETKPRANTICANVEAIVNNSKSLLLSPTNLLDQKRSISSMKGSDKRRMNLIRKCCNKDLSKPQNEGKLANALEQKLFKQIRDDDKEERMLVLKLRGKDKLNEYTSSALQEQEKWGTSGRQAASDFNTFGRKIQRLRKKDSVKEYSRDEIQRLVSNDVKLYIPSHAQYVRDYAKEIVRELLLQANSGVKYRNPVG